MSVDFIKSSWEEIVSALNRLSDEDIKKLCEERKDQLLSPKFAEKLKSSKLMELLDFFRLLPADVFAELLATHSDAFEELLKRDFTAIGALLSEVSKDHRKQFMRTMRTFLLRELKERPLRDLIMLMYNTVDVVLEGFVNSMKQVFLSPEFGKRLLSEPLEDVAEFISVLPMTFRGTFLDKHRDVLTSDEFVNRLKSADPDTRLKLIRWLPDDILDVLRRKAPEVVG